MSNVLGQYKPTIQYNSYDNTFTTERLVSIQTVINSTRNQKYVLKLWS